MNCSRHVYRFWLLAEKVVVKIRREPRAIGERASDSQGQAGGKECSDASGKPIPLQEDNRLMR
jgi:hypothetical protein